MVCYTEKAVWGGKKFFLLLDFFGSRTFLSFSFLFPLSLSFYLKLDQSLLAATAPPPPPPPPPIGPRPRLPLSDRSCCSAAEAAAAAAAATGEEAAAAEAAESDAADDAEEGFRRRPSSPEDEEAWRSLLLSLPFSPCLTKS